MSDSFWYSHDCDVMDRTAWCILSVLCLFHVFCVTSTQWLKCLGSIFCCTSGGLAFILPVLHLLVKAVAARILGTTVWTESFVPALLELLGCWSPYFFRRKHKHCAMSVFDGSMIAKCSKRWLWHAGYDRKSYCSVMFDQTSRKVKPCVFARVSGHAFVSVCGSLCQHVHSKRPFLSSLIKCSIRSCQRQCERGKVFLYHTE